MNSARTPELYRTRTGTSLHLFTCAHLRDTPAADRILVDPADTGGAEPCTWTADELNGTGREYFTSSEAALEALPLALENRALARGLIAEHEFEDVWIPNGRQYVAFARRGMPAVIFVNRGFADVRLDAGSYERTEFPTYGGSASAAGQSPRSGTAPEICPVHHMAIPASGICDDCG